VKKHAFELSDKALIMFDPDEDDIGKEYQNRKDLILCPIPFATLSRQSGADRVMRNTVAIAASFAVLEYDVNLFGHLISEIFAHKGREVVEHNLLSAKAGYEYAKAHFDNTLYPYRLTKIEQQPPKLVVSGNEAIGLGAIKAGVKFYAGYPMSPSTSILDFMAAHQLEYNIVVKHTEDEISAANMAIGAWHAGVRAMTASSGGGFSLMVESLGLSAMTETPMVYVDVQRPGPATGLATMTEQGDLQFVLHAAQGEFPRIVVAPGDPQECFYITMQAINLAETYQLPVIIISDSYLAQNTRSVPIFNDRTFIIKRGKLATQEELGLNAQYKRYDLSVDDGVSPRSLPGMAHGIFLANSDEHDEYGFSNEEGEMRMDMQAKRARRFNAASKELPEPVLHGPVEAEFTIFGWGSTKGAILEVMELLRRDKISVNFLQLLYISPFPSRAVNDVLENCKNPVLVENNMTGQLGSLITEYTGYMISNRILKYDGKPFFPEELYQRIKSLKSQKGLRKWLT